MVKTTLPLDVEERFDAFAKVNVFEKANTGSSSMIGRKLPSTWFFKEPLAEKPSRKRAEVPHS
jgi:hypothetical protein